MRRTGRARRHNHLGNYNPHWQPRPTRLRLIGHVPDHLQRIERGRDIGAAEKLQLDLLAEFQILPEDLDHLDSQRFGVIEREGKKLYRYRAKDYRIYFEKT